MPNDPDDIPCWQRLDARTTTSGRLAAADITRLAEIGVRHIINLALSDSPGGLADEDKQIEVAGLRYTHIPVPFDAPDERHFESFRSAYDNDAEPVHVHCIMNWRVSAFFYRYHRAKGMAQDEARAILERQWVPEATEHKKWAEFVARGQG